MHFGRNNEEHEFTTELEESESLHVIQKTLVERDLGVEILKWESSFERRHRGN